MTPACAGQRPMPAKPIASTFRNAVRCWQSGRGGVLLSVDRDNLGRGSRHRAEPRPSLRQLPAFLEQIAAAVSGFHPSSGHF